jgi:predicted nucleic acid-binding protein
MTKALIDSNIIVYSILIKETEKRKKALNLLESLLNSDYLVLTAQNMAESARVLTEKVTPALDKSAVAAELKSIFDSCPVFSYNSNTVINALDISNKFKIHFFDALIVATMKENGIQTIYTENTKDFENVPFINAINPFKNYKK